MSSTSGNDSNEKSLRREKPTADTSKETSKTESSKSSAQAAPRSSGPGGGNHIGWVLILTAIALSALVALYGFDQKYWLLPPEQKLISSWKADLNLIKDNKQAELLKRVKQVRLRANDHSPAAEWVEKIQAPIEKSPSGDVLADVFLIHQIEGHRYGVVVQYEFIDLKNNNKIGEFARTLWLGIYY